MGRAVPEYRKDGCARATVTTSAPRCRATALMWRVMAAGSDTAVFCALILPLGAWFTTEARKLRWSAKWFGADTRLSGSREIVFRYQLKSALPSSPREFLGCGVWFTSTLATGPTIRAERPRYGGGGVSVLGVMAMERSLSRSATRVGASVGSNVDTSRVRGKRYFGAALVLLLGPARHGDGSHDGYALHDRQGAGPRHDATVARHHQTLEPGLPGHARQLTRRLLKAGRRVGLVHGDLHCDGASTVHAPQRDHPAAVVDHHRGHRDVQLRGLGVRAAHHLDRFLTGDRHRVLSSGSVLSVFRTL